MKKAEARPSYANPRWGISMYTLGTGRRLIPSDQAKLRTGFCHVVTYYFHTLRVVQGESSVNNQEDPILKS